MLETGVYIITCVTNGKIYVGSTRQKFKFRLRQHLKQLRENKHHSKMMQNSFVKYGEANFSFDILERCEAGKITEREQYWIDFLQPKFNTYKIAGRIGPYTRTPEYKEKIRQRMKKARMDLSNSWNHEVDKHKEEIIKLYQSGWSIKVVANNFSVERQVVRRRLELWGIPLLTKSERYWLKHTKPIKKDNVPRTISKEMRERMANINKARTLEKSSSWNKALDTNKEEIIAYYNAGKTIKELAVVFSVDKGSISRRLGLWGVQKMRKTTRFNLRKNNL